MREYAGRKGDGCTWLTESRQSNSPCIAACHHSLLLPPPLPPLRLFEPYVLVGGAEVGLSVVKLVSKSRSRCLAGDAISALKRSRRSS